MLPTLEQARRHLDTIYDVSSLCSRLATTAETIPGVLRALAPTLPVRSAILYDGAASPPRIAGWRASDLDDEEGSFRAACNNLSASVARLWGESMQVPALEKAEEIDLPLRAQPLAGDRRSASSYAIMPLTIGREPFGAFQVETAQRMSEIDLALLAAATNQIALALIRDRAWAREVAAREHAEELQRVQEDLLRRERAARADAELAHRRLAFLAESSRLLMGTFDYAELLPRIAQIALREMADLCAIDVPERPPLDSVAIRASAIVRESTRDAEEVLQRFVSRVLATGRARVASELCDALAEPLNLETRKALRKVGIRSVLSVPLRAKGCVLGAITLMSATEDRYAPADLFVAEDLAQRISSAIESGRLYRQATHTIRDRDQLLEVVSQDLRGPLAQMLLTATSAKDKRHSDDLKKDLEVLRVGAARLSRTLVDLLDSAQADSRNLQIEPTDIHLSAVVEKAAAAVRPAAFQKKVKLDIRVRRSADDLFADPARLEQVIAALLENGIQASESGGQVSIQAQRMENHVRIVVTDTGKPIPRDALPHVFDRFWRVRNPAKLGPGLGLPIAKGIVEAHGGLIWVESFEGKGTTFTFSLPVR